jgi:3D (Asp-Asp-Asp) domain-containing protein
MNLATIALLLSSFWGQNVIQAPQQAAKPEVKVEIKEEARIEVIKSYAGEITAYSSREEETDDTPFITANGSTVHWGMVATNAYPFGTKMRFPDLYGDRIFTVKDRMHSRYKNRIDIWFPETDHAQRFGLQTTRVEIIQEKKPEEISMK